MIPTLLPARRDAYLRALNELVGCLSLQTFKQLNVANFCVMHGVKGDFLTALRDLDALELDLAKLAVQGETWYKRTPSLLDFTPEDVVAQMVRNLVDCSADLVAATESIGSEEKPTYDIVKDFVSLGVAALKAQFPETHQSTSDIDSASFTPMPSVGCLFQEYVHMPPGCWIRFFDSRTNEFIPDEEPVSDFVRDGLATLEAEFNKADIASDEAGKLREYARLCQKVAHDALRLADSTEQMVAAGLQLNFPLPTND